MSEMFRFKVVIVGEGGVGKTSLILRFVNDTFKDNYIPTLGVNFMMKDLPNNTRLIIWDIGGQNVWKAKLPLYLKGADGAIIIFDLTRPHTFNAVDTWISKIKEIVQQNIPFIIVGNKSDLAKDRKISPEEVEKFLKHKKVSMYYESSARTGQNVNEFFEQMGQTLVKHAESFSK